MTKHVSVKNCIRQAAVYENILEKERVMSNNFGLTEYMGFQELLTDEEKLVRETARNFVNEHVIPIIDEHAQKETFPQHLVKQMMSLGFLGSTLPAYR